MQVTIINTPLHLTLHGFAGIAVNKNYAGTAFTLSGNMWQAVKVANLPNKGQNIWVYEDGDKVFAGVELTGSAANTNLEEKQITLTKYAYYKHTGPYSLIKQAGQNMRDEIARLGLQNTLPYIEIYGHWNADESKLETGLVMSVV